MNSTKYPKSKSTSVEQPKVAEPAASYVTSDSTSAIAPMARSRRIAGLEASDEVWEFAQGHQLVSHLETAVRLVRESFHDIRLMYLTFDPDPEERTLDGIVIQIRVGGPVEEWEKQYRIYALKFIKEVPNEFRSKICLFYY